MREPVVGLPRIAKLQTKHVPCRLNAKMVKLREHPGASSFTIWNLRLRGRGGDADILTTIPDACAHSEYFRDFYVERASESLFRENVTGGWMPLEDTDHGILKAIVDSWYSGVIVIDPVSSYDIFAAAHYLKSDDVLEACIRYFEAEVADIKLERAYLLWTSCVEICEDFDDLSSERAVRLQACIDSLTAFHQKHFHFCMTGSIVAYMLILFHGSEPALLTKWLFSLMFAYGGSIEPFLSKLSGQSMADCICLLSPCLHRFGDVPPEKLSRLISSLPEEFHRSLWAAFPVALRSLSAILLRMQSAAGVTGPLRIRDESVALLNTTFQDLRDIDVEVIQCAVRDVAEKVLDIDLDGLTSLAPSAELMDILKALKLDEPDSDGFWYQLCTDAIDIIVQSVNASVLPAVVLGRFVELTNVPVSVLAPLNQFLLRALVKKAMGLETGSPASSTVQSKLDGFKISISITNLEKLMHLIPEADHLRMTSAAPLPFIDIAGNYIHIGRNEETAASDEEEQIPTEVEGPSSIHTGSDASYALISWSGFQFWKCDPLFFVNLSSSIVLANPQGPCLLSLSTSAKARDIGQPYHEYVERLTSELESGRLSFANYIGKVYARKMEDFAEYLGKELLDSHILWLSSHISSAMAGS